MTWAVDGPGDLVHKLTQGTEGGGEGESCRIGLCTQSESTCAEPRNNGRLAMKNAAEKIAEFAREWSPGKFEHGVGISTSKA